MSEHMGGYVQNPSSAKMPVCIVPFKLLQLKPRNGGLTSALLHAGTTEGSPPQQEGDRGRKPTWMLPPARPAFPPIDGIATFDWGRFQGHFVKTAGRIVDRMNSNMDHIVSTTKKGIAEIFGSNDR